MNNLNRRLILIATTTLALTATAGFLVQTDALNNLKDDFGLLFKENEKNKKNLDAQAILINQMDEEIRVKDDSITTLIITIDGLVSEINVLKEKIRSKDQKVQQLSSQVKELSGEINHLKNGSAADQAKILELEAERDDLLQQMVEIDKKREEEKKKLKVKKEAVNESNKELDELEKPFTASVAKENDFRPEPQPAMHNAPASINDQMEVLIKARKQARMTEIVAKTEVDFQRVLLRDEKDGKDLNKLKNDGWRYTMIDFNLIHPNPDAIVGEAFILQVFDVDNEKVVPVNESNPGFPDSEIGSTGYRFVYDGSPLSIPYFNSQQKTSKNYEVRLYYAGKGYLIRLPNGTTRIVEDGNVVE